MEPVTTISGVLGLVKTTADLITAYRKRKKADPETEKLLSEIESRLFSLQKEVLQLKEQEIALVEENSKLRGQIRSNEERTAKREQYTRTQVGKSIVVVGKDEPGVFYCPVCFDAGKMNPIQPLPDAFAGAGITHRCAPCESIFNLE
jgi:hypothetical protein